MNPHQRYRMGNLLMAGQFDRPAQSPLGVQERVPYPGEVDFFKSSGIPGYAADDDQIVMNPFNPPALSAPISVLCVYTGASHHA